MMKMISRIIVLDRLSKQQILKSIEKGAKSTASYL
jgi:hypothetical protein